MRSHLIILSILGLMPSSAAFALDEVVLRFNPPVGKDFRETHLISNELKYQDPKNPDSQKSGGNSFHSVRDFAVRKSGSGFEFVTLIHSDPSRKFETGSGAVSYKFDSNGNLMSVEGYESFIAAEEKKGLVSAKEVREVKEACASGRRLAQEQAIWADRLSGIYGKKLRAGTTWSYVNKLPGDETTIAYKVVSIEGSGADATVEIEGSGAKESSENQKIRTTSEGMKRFGAQPAAVRHERISQKITRRFSVESGLVVEEKRNKNISGFSTLGETKFGVSEQHSARTISLAEVK